MSACGAVIVAGGASHRMGQAKEWLEIGGMPLLRWIVERLRPACTTMVVVGRRGQALPDRPHVVRLDDPEHQAPGPLRGLHTGLRWLRDQDVELAYLGASDNPFTSLPHVQFLFERLQREPALEAVVPGEALDGGGVLLHPLCSGVRVEAAVAAAETLLHEGVSGAKMLFSRIPSAIVGIEQLPDPDILRPCNTPQQWAEALARLGLP